MEKKIPERDEGGRRRWRIRAAVFIVIGAVGIGTAAFALNALWKAHLGNVSAKGTLSSTSHLVNDRPA